MPSLILKSDSLQLKLQLFALASLFILWNNTRQNGIGYPEVLLLPSLILFSPQTLTAYCVLSKEAARGCRNVVV